MTTERSAVVLRGVVPAVLTPFDVRGAVDHAALERLIERVVGGGVHGIFVAGTQGEFYALTRPEYAALLEATVRCVDRRVPVFAGVSAQSTSVALEHARVADSAGADAVVSLPPFFPTPTAGEVLWHFEALSEDVGMPVVVYNHPGYTHFAISVDLALRLSELESVIGFKDSSGDLALTLEMRRTLPQDVGVLLGQDALIAYGLMGGADGTVATTANVVPRLVVAIWDAVNAGRYADAVELQQTLAPLRDMFRIAGGAVVLKAALEILGHDVGRCRPPTRPLPPDARDALVRIVSDLKTAERAAGEVHDLERALP